MIRAIWIDADHREVVAVDLPDNRDAHAQLAVLQGLVGAPYLESIMLPNGDVLLFDEDIESEVAHWFILRGVPPIAGSKLVIVDDGLKLRGMNSVRPIAGNGVVVGQHGESLADAIASPDDIFSRLVFGSSAQQQS